MPRISTPRQPHFSVPACFSSLVNPAHESHRYFLRCQAPVIIGACHCARISESLSTAFLSCGSLFNAFLASAWSKKWTGGLLAVYTLTGERALEDKKLVMQDRLAVVVLH
jgi:hypothetical protein